MLHQTVRRFSYLLAVILLLTGIAPTSSTAQQVLTIGIGQSRGFGMDSLRNGRPDVAEAIALALLKRNPNDVQALLMLSGAQTALGKTQKGANTGKHAYAIAKTRIEMFAAARAVASAKALTEN
jgi:hypothetical protein